MKITHSLRVAENCKHIAIGIGLSGTLIYEATIMGLFHDIGRFRQLRDYGTFSDNQSLNHAELGASILESEDFLDGFGSDTKAKIIKGVRLHNLRELPDSLSSDELVFAQIIRDADKLDIYDVLYVAWKTGELERHPELMFGIPLEGLLDPMAVEQIKRKEIISYSNMKSLPDFFLTQLSWVYDINFPATYKIIKERNIIANILEVLKDQPGIEDIVAEAQLRIDSYISEN
jgi:hypothetical protein